MLASFSNSLRGLGTAVVHEDVHAEDKMDFHTEAHCRAHYREVETGQSGLTSRSEDWRWWFFLVFSTWRDDFGTRTKKIKSKI